MNSEAPEEFAVEEEEEFAEEEPLTVRQIHLLRKYGYHWLVTVFASGTADNRFQGDDAEAGVWCIDIKGDYENERVHPCHLRELVPGAPVHQHGESAFGSLTAGFPRGARYLPCRKQHYSNNKPDHMTVTFARPTRVYVLLPALMQEPRWLRALFSKQRDPNMVPVEMAVHWRFDRGEWLQYFTLGNFGSARQQRLKVFKSDNVYRPGQQLVLGGPGLADVMDTGLVVAFKAQKLGSTVSAARRLNSTSSLLRGLLIPGLNASQQGMLAGDKHVGFSDNELPQMEASESGIAWRTSENGIAWRTSDSGAPAANASFDFDDWVCRVIKATKRGRLKELRALIEYDRSQPRHRSHLVHNDISVLPPTEKEMLLTDIPAKSQQLEVLCTLLYYCKCSMSYLTLRFLVHHWEDVPLAYAGGCQGLLIDHLRHQHSPLSVLSGFMRVVRLEIADRLKVKPTVLLEDSLALFTVLMHTLLQRTQLLVREDLSLGEGYGFKLVRFKALLDFKLYQATRRTTRQREPSTLSDFRPLRVAFADNDAHFMHAPVVQDFVRLSWRGQDWLMETSKGNRPDTLAFLNPAIIHVVMCNHGLCPEWLHTMRLVSGVWHLHTFSSQAYFNSARARWVMRVLSTIVFLLLYVQVAGSLLPSWHGDTYFKGHMANDNSRDATLNLSIFLLFALGNVLETGQTLGMRTKEDAVRIVSANKTILLNLGLDLVLLAISLVFLLTSTGVCALSELAFLRLEMVWSAMSPVLWGRALIVLIPLFSDLGPMLGTFKAMLSEVAMFAIPWAVITVGFSVALQSILGPIGLPGFYSFGENLLMLFIGFYDSVDWDSLEPLSGLGLDPEEAQAYRLYGTLIFAIYSIVSTVLLGNLLIAIITNRYRPDEAKAQASLNFAEVVDYHAFQVDHFILGSPFNIVALLTWWLPGGMRVKKAPKLFAPWAQNCLDGFVPATPRSLVLPAGRYEIPHLVYQLTLVPLMIAASTVGFFLHMPICIGYFGAVGHKKLLNQIDAFQHTGSNAKLASGGLPTFGSYNRSAGGPSVRDNWFCSEQGYRDAAWMRERSVGAKSLAHAFGTTATYRSAQVLTSRGNSSSQVIPASGSRVSFGSGSGRSTSLDGSGAPASVGQRVASAVKSAVCAAVATVLGSVAYVVIGLSLILLWSLWVWIGAVTWSLYNIASGIFSAWMDALCRVGGTLAERARVSPTSASSVKGDRQQMPAHECAIEESMERLRADRLEAAQLIDLDTLDKAIDATYGPGTAASTRMPPPKSLLKRAASRRGVRLPAGCLESLNEGDEELAPLSTAASLAPHTPRSMSRPASAVRQSLRGVSTEVAELRVAIAGLAAHVSRLVQPASAASAAPHGDDVPGGARGSADTPSEWSDVGGAPGSQV